MPYLVTISEQHLSIYEVLVHKLEQFIETLHMRQPCIYFRA